MQKITEISPDLVGKRIMGSIVGRKFEDGVIFAHENNDCLIFYQNVYSSGRDGKHPDFKYGCVISQKTLSMAEVYLKEELQNGGELNTLKEPTYTLF